MISPYRSCFDVQLVVTRRAFIALERPVGMVDWMLGHPFSNADLALDHAALKGDVALVAVGDDFFDAVSGASRQNMTENGNKRHEHQAFLAPAVPTCKADASRGDGRAFGRCVDQRLCARGLGSISPHAAFGFGKIPGLAIKRAADQQSLCHGGVSARRAIAGRLHMRKAAPSLRRQVSTMPRFFVVHEAEYAREFIEAEVASFSFPLAVFVFGVPVSQKDIPIFCREVCFANWTSDLRVRWRLRNFQVRDRV